MKRSPGSRAAPAFVGGTLRLEWPESGIGLLTLDRPAALNAIDVQMIDEIGSALAAAQRERARVLVITGRGRAFCAGADLKMLTDRASPVAAGPMAFRDGFLDPLARVLDSLEEMPFPVIAAINGHALGGGCEIALSADLRVMAADAVLGLPEVKLGATPGAGGVQKLIRHVGRAKALEWILLGASVSAEEAERRGLLVEVAPGSSVLSRAMALARRLCELGPVAVAQAKKSIYLAEDSDLRTARRFGVEALTVLSATDEWKEGVRAFAEKRPPDFGRAAKVPRQRR